jgi:Arc/MetJ-type ribon-helix-helix transcriptional regulator
LEVFELSRKVPVNISKELVDEIHRRVDESGGEFKTVEEFIEFVLTEVLREEEPEQVYTAEEEEAIKERLRRLGYIQ